MNVVSNNNIKCTVALAELHNVMDPEIGLNVVDLGLIYALNFDEDNHKVICSMTLTTQFCPMGESITNGVEVALHKAFPGYSVEVSLVFEPAWSYERITEEGQNFLNQR